MKNHALAVLSCLALFAQSAFAVTPVDSTLDASIAYKTSLSVQCTGENCTNERKLDLTASHSFSLSQVQASQITSDTLVQFKLFYYSQISFFIGEDPTYAPGKTSALVTKTYDVFGTPMPVTVLVNWTDGNFHLFAAIKADVAGAGGLAMAEPPNENAVAEKAKNGMAGPKGLMGINAIQLITSLVDTTGGQSTQFAADEVYLAVDSKNSSKGASTATGNSTSKYSEQLKSRFITDTPPVVE